MIFTLLGVTPLRGPEGLVLETCERAALVCCSTRELCCNMSVQNEEITCYEDCLFRQS